MHKENPIQLKICHFFPSMCVCNKFQLRSWREHLINPGKFLQNKFCNQTLRVTRGGAVEAETCRSAVTTFLTLTPHQTPRSTF